MPKIDKIEETPNPSAVPFLLNEPVTSGTTRSFHTAEEGAADPLVARINEMLDERIRPYVASDGGWLEVLSLDEHTLTIHYQGACGSCPSSLSGTLMAIENMIRQEIDPDIEVVAV